MKKILKKHILIIAACFALFAGCKKDSDYVNGTPAPYISNLDLRKHIKPLLYIFLTIFSISIYFSLDTILLGFLANNESVGYYSTALKLNKLII